MFCFQLKLTGLNQFSQWVVLINILGVALLGALSQKHQVFVVLRRVEMLIGILFHSKIKLI